MGNSALYRVPEWTLFHGLGDIMTLPFASAAGKVKRKRRAGSGKAKGSEYERSICKKLSLWLTNGKKEDCFWRSAMSGGRATVAKKAGRDIRQAGDITAVAPEGHALTDYYYIECKFYKNLNIDSFILDGKGQLAKFWYTTIIEAAKHHRQPILIAKENGRQSIVVFRAHPGFHLEDRLSIHRVNEISSQVAYLDDALKGTFK